MSGDEKAVDAREDRGERHSEASLLVSSSESCAEGLSLCGEDSLACN